MGFRRMAFKAGIRPDTIPTTMATLTDTITDQMDIGTSYPKAMPAI